MREFTVIIERDEDGNLVGSVPSLKGCHTQAQTVDELFDRMKEAIRFCLEEAGDEALESLKLIGVHRVKV